MGVNFRLFGIPIHFHVSFLLIGFFLGYGPGRSPSFVLTAVGLIALAMLWHEMAHALAFRCFGVESEIRLLGFFGFTYPRDMKQVTDGQMLVVAAAGPLAGLLLAAVCRVLMPPASPFQPNSILEQLMIANFVISVANLIPIYPLDGGRIMKALLRMVTPNRGEPIAYAISLVVGAGALWYSANHGDQFTSLFVLALVAINFLSLRAGGLRLPGATPG